MSDILNQAVEALNGKLDGKDFNGTAKFTLDGEGSIVMDSSGARISDDPAEVTLTADADTFKGIMDGDTDATSAFMAGKLQVDGDMGMAMSLASVLS